MTIWRQDDQEALNRAFVTASLVAGWKPEDFKSCLNEQRSAELSEFLAVETDQLNQQQRIVILSEHFAEETLATSKWLGGNHGVDICCLHLAMYRDCAVGDRYLTCTELPPDEGVPEAAPAVAAVVEFTQPVVVAASIDASREPDGVEAASPAGSASTGPASARAAAPAPDEVDAGLSVAITEASEVSLVPQDVDATAPLSTAAASEVVFSEMVEELIAEPASSDEPELASDLIYPELFEDVASPDQPAPRLKQASAPAPPSPAPPVEDPELPVEVDHGERRFKFFPRPWMALSAAVAIIVLAAALTIDGLLPPESDSENQAAASMLLTGTVTDGATGQPILGASVYYASQRSSTDETGRFQFSRQPEAAAVLVRAAGYRQTELSLDGSLEARLEPFEVRAVYLSQDAMEAPDRLERVQKLLRESRLNSVIVAVKSPRGHLSLETDHPLARGSGVARLRLPNRSLAGDVKRWREEGLYTIAYIALFRDNSVASARPKLALRSLTTRQIVRDATGMAWTDPEAEDVRAYNIAVAKAAAEAGFDEIQFDFVRYPSTPESTEGATSEVLQQRLETIVSFLREAAAALAPHNVYVSASVLGSVCTMRRAGSVGQRLEEFASAVDYVAPMLYPSSFAPSSSRPEPLAESFEIVSENLAQATTRLDGHGKKLRPWLQNFPPQTSPRAPLAPEFIGAQIKGVATTGASGWMLWDGTSRYPGTLEALDAVSKAATPDPTP